MAICNCMRLRWHLIGMKQYKQSIFQHSVTSCDLENAVKVTKTYLVLVHVQIHICAGVVQIQPALREIWCEQVVFYPSTLKKESRSPKSNLFLPNNMSVTLVKIKPSLPKIWSSHFLTLKHLVGPWKRDQGHSN